MTTQPLNVRGPEQHPSAIDKVLARKLGPHLVTTPKHTYIVASENQFRALDRKGIIKR